MAPPVPIFLLSVGLVGAPGWPGAGAGAYWRHKVKFLGSHQRSASSYGLPKSSYNILGLRTRPETEQNLLMQLCDGKFGIAFGESPFIILGEVPCPNLQSLVTVPDPEFYIVKMQSLEIGGQIVVSQSNLIIDSGSNMMFCSKMVKNMIFDAAQKGIP